MSPTWIARAMLEVDAASKPISGRFVPADGGEPRRFTGWIELTGAIESMRTATPGLGAHTPAGADDAATPDIGAPR